MVKDKLDGKKVTEAILIIAEKLEKMDIDKRLLDDISTEDIYIILQGIDEYVLFEYREHLMGFFYAADHRKKPKKSRLEIGSQEINGVIDKLINERVEIAKKFYNPIDSKMQAMQVMEHIGNIMAHFKNSRLYFNKLKEISFDE